MSQHEIEDLIERSVNVLDKQPLDEVLLRDLIVNLFRYQNGFDCSDTHGRVRAVLLRRRALLQLPLAVHPDAAAFGALFARLAADDSGWLTPGTRSDGSPGLTVSRNDHPSLWAGDATSVIDAPNDVESRFDDGVSFCDGALQIDVGSSLWQRLQARGSFTGLDAEAPRLLPPQRVAAAVVEAARAAGDRQLMSFWYAALPAFVLTLGGLGSEFAGR
jgi:hypothetical protein